MSKIPLGTPGIVYVLSNDSMPGLLKIGATTLDAFTRAKQLTAATASPTPFNVLMHRNVPDVNMAERAIHNLLAAYRVNDKREFFKVSFGLAAGVIDKMFGTGLPLTKEVATPFAELFASFVPNESNELTMEEQARCRELEQRIRVVGR